MAIEVLIMPLSRYWAGDYVTPGMQRALDPSAPRYKAPARRFSRHDASLPGGPERAAQERTQLLEKRIPQLIRNFPYEASSGWIETSETEPLFFELERAGYEHVLMDGQDASFDHMPHLLTASIFLPPRFVRTFEREGLQYGSIPVLTGELRKVSWSRDAEQTAALFAHASTEALRLNLPLFVDL